MQILSANGSIIFPNSVTWFIFLARYPSIISVKEANKVSENSIYLLDVKSSSIIQKGIANKSIRPAPFGQREQSAGKTAEGAWPSGKPVESAKPHGGFGWHAKAAQRGEQGYRRRGAAHHRRRHNASTVRCSNPTISLYATVMAAKVTGTETSKPTIQHNAPRTFTSAIRIRNSVKPASSRLT